MNPPYTAVIILLIEIQTDISFPSEPVFATPLQDVQVNSGSQYWDQKLSSDNTSDLCNSSRFACVLPDIAHPQGAAVRMEYEGLESLYFNRLKYMEGELPKLKRMYANLALETWV